MSARLTDGLRRAAQVNPDGTATVFAEQRQTWSEVAERVARLAGGLRALGVSDGHRVGVLAWNSDRYFEAYYAIAWAGAVIVPLNTRLAAPGIAAILQDSGVVALLVDPILPPRC